MDGVFWKAKAIIGFWFSRIQHVANTWFMAVESTPRLLSVKELAAALGRSESYVRKMKGRGFKMIAGRATLAAALKWLEKNPSPCAELAAAT